MHHAHAQSWTWELQGHDIPLTENSSPSCLLAQLSYQSNPPVPPACLHCWQSYHAATQLPYDNSAYHYGIVHKAMIVDSFPLQGGTALLKAALTAVLH